MKLVLRSEIEDTLMGVVGEPTGYFDKNGKELFVGDVVNHWKESYGETVYEGVMVVGEQGSCYEGKFFLYGIGSACKDGKFIDSWVAEYSHSLTKVGEYCEWSMITVVEGGE